MLYITQANTGNGLLDTFGLLALLSFALISFTSELCNENGGLSTEGKITVAPVVFN